MVENKRKKFHDKDKYYRLAKEQGLRSRAAFKLTQINRKFNVLQNCKHGVLDLCAAPGGWTQIASRTCPTNIPIVAVDILPVRSLHRPNVITLVGDITTEKCKAEIQRVLKQQNGTGVVDLVLHDGAPNVGADYSKDAYEQNELVVHAVKTATQHLKRGGTLITKVYRSRDYAALQWMLQQLWDDVTAFKPTASRPQSAEIFVICQGYKAPTKLDPALLDPRRVFEMVAGDTATGGGDSSSNNPSASMTILHKNWDKHRRKRGGYDMEHLDFSMRHIEPVGRFVEANFKDAIQLISACTGLAFQCKQCNDEDVDDEATATPCHCSFLLHHPLTSPEIIDCVKDLQVLNKSDFKGLLNWRTKMQDALEQQKEDEGKDNGDNDSKASADSDRDDEDDDSEVEEAKIQKEIAELRRQRLRERKRQTKKDRAVASKRRRQAALGGGGMTMDVMDVPENDQIFSLAQFRSARELPSEVNLDEVTDEQLFGNADDNEDHVIVGQAEGSDSDDDDDDGPNDAVRAQRRERDLDEAYNEYLSNTKDGLAKSGTKMAKRSKKVQRDKIVQEAQEDQEMAQTGAEHVAHDALAYAKLLQRGDHDDSDGDDESSSDEADQDDGFDADPLTPEEHLAKQQSKAKKTAKKAKTDPTILNPLLHQFADEPTSAKTARWFSNPLFANLGKAAQAATAGGNPRVVEPDSESGSESDRNARAVVANKKKRKLDKEETKPDKITADEVLASMPKTDKQIRHEKRLKAMERDQRKKAKREKKLGMEEGDFQLVSANDDDENADDDAEKASNQALMLLTEPQRKKVLEARELIKAGLGSTAGQDDADMASKGIEIVSQDETSGPLPILDSRKYDSENEDYDSDDYAETLALGTMMLRRSKEKAFVDASYNRYAWNDPGGLPDWFVDDESKHYRPQLPIPPALLAKMKEKMMALSSKPIAKVAEARARKNKRAKAKLTAAKKQAEAVANSSEMSEAMKLKAISKALQGQESKRPGKSYVVAKKGRGGKGVKGAKVVDKRLKADKRATSRIEKKRKKGKQNGMVGSKKRRHHS